MSYSDPPYQRGRRLKLVEELRQKGITDERCLEAIGKVPRHIFVHSIMDELAYEDIALPIDGGQTISQPFTVAFQIQLLELEPGAKVLEIGTGSGYQCAVLAAMGMEVFSIERIKKLHENAKILLMDILGIENVHLFYGDGYEGLPEHAPFHGIIITAAMREKPLHLLAQLIEGGKIVVPVGKPDHALMHKITYHGEDKYTDEIHGVFKFVPFVRGLE